MADVPCFLLTPSNRYRVTLYRSARGDGGCGGGHYAEAVGGDEVHAEAPTGGHPEAAARLAGDPRWPAACAQCGRAFEPGDERRVFFRTLYDRGDGGPPCTIADAPPGAMWDAPWMPESMRGPDGRCLFVRLPNGRDWAIDSEANNCTRKGDRTHQCWVRHGEPPRLTVDKQGDTCDAGAGSIQSGDYHGYLRGGVLVGD